MAVTGKHLFTVVDVCVSVYKRESKMAVFKYACILLNVLYVYYAVSVRVPTQASFCAQIYSL
jgi:hypothetical protein